MTPCKVYTAVAAMAVFSSCLSGTSHPAVNTGVLVHVHPLLIVITTVMVSESSPDVVGGLDGHREAIIGVPNDGVVSLVTVTCGIHFLAQANRHLPRVIRSMLEHVSVCPCDIRLQGVGQTRRCSASLASTWVADIRTSNSVAPSRPLLLSAPSG